MAREFTKAGLNVVGLERGQDHIPGKDFTLPNSATNCAMRRGSS